MQNDFLVVMHGPVRPADLLFSQSMNEENDSCSRPMLQVSTNLSGSFQLDNGCQNIFASSSVENQMLFNWEADRVVIPKMDNSCATKTESSYSSANYVDHYYDPVYDLAAFSVASKKPSSETKDRSSGRKAKSSERFPKTLYNVLHETSNTELESTIVWQPHGRSFIVRDKIRLTL